MMEFCGSPDIREVGRLLAGPLGWKRGGLRNVHFEFGILYLWFVVKSTVLHGADTFASTYKCTLAGLLSLDHQTA